MDDLAFGCLVRLARIERRWRQQDLAGRAGISRALVSRLERGHLSELDLGVIRRIAEPLGIRVELVGRARVIDLDRVANARHSALQDHLVPWIRSFEGWDVRAEVTYSEFGERGSIDLLCWHAQSRSLLVVEVKTELLEFGSLLAKLDAKGRLAATIAGRFTWKPATASMCLLVADSTTNRRRATAHAALLGTVLRDDGRALIRWLRKPAGAVAAIRFVPDVRPGHARSGFAAPAQAPRRAPRSDGPAAAG